MGGDVSAWTAGKKGAFERAGTRILNAEVRLVRVTAASVLVNFIAYAYKGVYIDELSVAAKLRNATIVRRLKEALAQETGSTVESDPRVIKTTVFAFSTSGELVGRATFARTSAIVGGVLGGFFGVVLLVSLALGIVCCRRRQAVAKSRSSTPVRGLQATAVPTGRV